jgi:hypothetical protein
MAEMTIGERRSSSMAAFSVEIRGGDRHGI